MMQLCVHVCIMCSYQKVHGVCQCHPVSSISLCVFHAKRDARNISMSMSVCLYLLTYLKDRHAKLYQIFYAC